MVTKLNAPLKREIMIDKLAYVLTISNAGFKLTLKGRRKGLEIDWHDLVSGDEALAVALRASLTAPTSRPQQPKHTRTKKRRV